MKRSGICPKCDSQNIASDAKAVDYGHGNAAHDMRVRVFRNPDGFWSKGAQTSTVSAYICLECGFVEYYADDPQALMLPTA